MFRTVVFAVAVIGFTAHTASAQQLTYKGVPLRQAFSTSLTFQAAPAPQSPVKSFAQPRPAAKARAAAKTSTQSKSFWHTPWPYVIAGAAAVTIILIAHNGSGHTVGGGY